MVKNKWNGPLGYIVVFVPMTLLLGSVWYFFDFKPKVAVCRAYYSKVSTWDCYMTFDDMQRRNK